MNREQEKIFIGEKNGEIRVWDIDKVKYIDTLKRHKSAISCISLVGKRQQQIASGSHWGKTIYIWDTTNLNCVGRIGIHEQIINMFWNNYDEFVIVCSRKAFKFNHCNFRGYEETPTVHDFTSNNLVIVDNNESLIGGSKKKHIVKVSFDYYTQVDQ